MRKRISRLTARTLPGILRLYGVMIGASIPAAQHQRGIRGALQRRTMADLAFLAMTGKKRAEAEARPLHIDRAPDLERAGPSAQGAKGAVSADGPHTPSGCR